LQFMRQNQGFHESLSRLMDLPSNELSNFEKKIGDLRSATERNLELIRNYRH